MRRCYYDTGLFLYFFNVKDEITKSNEFYYLNNKIEKHISLFVTEEFLQVMQRDLKDLQEEYKTDSAYQTFMDVWDKLDTFITPFKQENIDLKEIKIDLYKILNIIRNLNIDLVAERGAKNALDIMDWFHLITADYLGCDDFLTTDQRFGFLKKLYDDKTFKFKSLKDIIVFKLDKDTMQLNQTDTFYLPWGVI